MRVAVALVTIGAGMAGSAKARCAKRCSQHFCAAKYDRSQTFASAAAQY
jgi:hypothetical protein